MTEDSVWVKVVCKKAGAVAENDEDYVYAGDPFKITPRPDDVNALKNQVKERKPNDLANLDADRLLVFPPGEDYKNAENKLNSWDPVPQDTTGPNPLIVVAPTLPQQPTIMDGGTYVLGPPRQQQINLILPVLIAMATANLDAWDRSSEARTKVESKTVRQSVLEFYGIKSKTYCQIAGPRTKNVVNAHIWPKGSKANLPLLDLNPDDIDNPRNILRLHRTLERFFDHKQLTFQESGRGHYEMKVLDKSILDEVLKGSSSTLKVGNLEGRPLKFPNASRPWRRILGLHSIMAHRHARAQRWLTDADLTDAESRAQAMINHSLDQEAQERLNLFLRDSAHAGSTRAAAAAAAGD